MIILILIELKKLASFIETRIAIKVELLLNLILTSI